MIEYPRLGAVRRMIGARRFCMAFQVCMFPSPSGSWWTAPQTGPPIDMSRVASRLAQESPLHLAIAAQEYGALKLIHGSRFFAASALAVRTAELTSRPPQ